MNRLAFIVLCAMLSSAALGQQSYEFVNIIELDESRSTQETHKAAKRWIMDAFRDAKDVIQMEDIENNTVVGRGSFRFKTKIFFAMYARAGNMYFSIEVTVKEGRARVRMYDFRHEGSIVMINGTSDPAINLGLIHDGEDCCPEYRGKLPSPAGVCKKEIWPQIKAHEEWVVTELTKALTNPDGSSRPTDW